MADKLRNLFNKNCSKNLLLTETLLLEVVLKLTYLMMVI